MTTTTTPTFATVSSKHPVQRLPRHEVSSLLSTNRDCSPIRKTNSDQPVTHEKDWMGSRFHGATIQINVININITQQIQQAQLRRKRYIIDDSVE